MPNGTRCIVCGRFVYARHVPGNSEPDSYVCDRCR